MKKAALPLPSLLSHVLIAFSRDYADSGNGLPSLAVLSNILRVIEDGGVGYKELPSLGRISRRAVRIATQFLEGDGWLAVEPAAGKGPKIVRLTPIGKQARAVGQAHHKSTEWEWATRYGKTCITKLRDALGALVKQVDIELPHYPTGYGQGDISMTGGHYIPAESGPPRIPAHGQEWPVVLRGNRDLVSELPLTALISQTLTAFTIDYDHDVETQSGGLQGAVTFFRFVGDEGVPLGKASQIGDVTGSGRSTLERHGLVIVEPGTRRDEQRLVTLTSRGRRVRDKYPTLVFDVERRWRSLLGANLIDDLRESLEALDDKLDDDLPDFPDTNGWLRRPRNQRHQARM